MVARDFRLHWLCAGNSLTRMPITAIWRPGVALHRKEEWRRFSEERLKAKYARAKCC